jgi:hypothetical protein
MKKRLEEYLKENDITKEKWNETLDRVMEKGIGKSCIDIYTISKIIEWCYTGIE